MAARQKTCVICGLSDGHTLMDCPYRCEFCGISVNNCECHDSSIVSSVLALETPEKEGRSTETSTSTPAPPQAAREKRKGSTDDWCGTSNKTGQKRPEKTVPEKKFKEAKNDLQAAMKQLKKSEELNRKKDEEYQETIAALERRIEELEESVSKGKSEQKSAATEVDTDDGTDQTSDTDIGEDDFIEDDNWEKETKDDEEGAECAQKKTKELPISGSNLEGIHRRYKGVLRILQKHHCSLTEAMRRFGIARNTLRDYIGLCELKIVDPKRYERILETEREKTGKISAKRIERRCRVTLKELKTRVNELKEEKQLLPFYPNDGFYS